MKNLITEYLIVGAGLSGLFLAAQLGGRSYEIIEAAPIIGGYCKTTKRNGFVWDYAGHFFHFKNERMRKMFKEALLPSEYVEVKKNTKILYQGQYIDYPFQKNIHQLPKDQFIDCLYDLFLRTPPPVNGSFIDMLYGNFGKSITNKFLRPYNEKLYACDLAMLDANAMGRFFPHANIDEIVSNFKNTQNESYNDSFLYPREGAQRFIDSIYEHIDPIRFHLNTKILSIDKQRKIAYTNNSVVSFDKLISTIPITQLYRLMGYSENSAFTYNKVLTLNIGFNGDSCDSLRDVHWIYVPEKDYHFYRIGFYNHIVPTSRLSVYVEIGYSMYENIDIEEELNYTLRDMKKLGIVEPGMSVVDWEAVVMDPAYVHINEKAQALKNEREIEMRKHGVLTLGRYGGWKYCSMEDCMLDALSLTDDLDGLSE